MSFAKSALLVAALAGLAARADITPTAPWGGVVDNTGGPCDIQWNIDATGEWKDVSIYLMTGSNQNFIQLAEVATGIDGTTGDGKYSWTCPDVTINAPIYFYAFSNNGAPVSTWTTRFTIASASGQTVPAPQSTQPDGSATPWGTGAIVGQSSGGGGAAVSSGVSSGATSGSSSAATGVSSGSSSGPSSAAFTRSSAATTASSASSSRSSDGQETTVITAEPSSTTSRMQTTTRSTVSSGINGNAQNSSSSSNNSNTGAASATHGSVAGIGLLLAVLAGLWVA